MSKTLPKNYARNVEILRENIRRGMSHAQAAEVIRRMERQFKRAGLYGEAEREFIATMWETLTASAGGVDISVLMEEIKTV